MVHLAQCEEAVREHLLEIPCPTLTSSPYVAGLKVSQARIALLLHRRSDRPSN